MDVSEASRRLECMLDMFNFLPLVSYLIALTSLGRYYGLPTAVTAKGCRGW
jgi:hypothetical protein